MKNTLTGLILLLSSIGLFAQDQPCACCTDSHSQFDFWVGKWEVFDKAGTKVGTNTIDKLHDFCVLQENWVGALSTTGTSFNFFDPSDKTWNQLWLDNNGTILKLKGRFTGGKMILQSEALDGRNGKYINRITWEPMEDGSVIQTWEALDTSGLLLRTLFTGIYIREG